MRSQEALILAQQQAHSFSLVHTLAFTAFLHQSRRTNRPPRRRQRQPLGSQRSRDLHSKGIRHHRAWLGAHRPGPGGGGHAPDTPRACRLSGHGGRDRLHVFWPCWPRRMATASRRKLGCAYWPGAGSGAENWRVFL
jgi:hypothetical protein